MTPQDVLAAVRATVKYAQLSDALILRVAAQEIPKRRKANEVIEAVRNKLHQVAGLYQEPRMRYARWFEELDAAAGMPDAAAVKDACLQLMAHHTSTRERAPLLDAFYARVFDGLPAGATTSVLDIACGLNPLAAPWMPLAPGAMYHAVDVYADMMAFLGRALDRLGIRVEARVQDVLDVATPLPEVDVALILKTIPCLEQVDRDAGARLLDRIRARILIVSYPTRSVGGKNVGMAEQYAQRFAELVEGRGWVVEQFEFENELMFRVKT